MSQAAGMDWVAQRVLHQSPQQESEITRICRLPVAEPLLDEEVEELQRLHIKPEAYEEGFRLLRVQVEALQAYIEHDGMFGPIEVGGGKTLISLRIAAIATEKGLSRVCLVVPNQVYPQLMDHDIQWARKRVNLAGIPFYGLGNMSPSRRLALAGNRRGCWVMPYSLLSRPDTFEMLTRIDPQLLIFDEAHNLKNRDAARTRRVRHFVRDNNPQVVCLSGTMTSKSLKDYAHLLGFCLRMQAPVPLDSSVAQDWAAVLDSEQAATESFNGHGRKTSAGTLRPLINWARQHFPADDKALTFDVQGFRRAFQHRLLTAPGVVSSPPDRLGVSLHIENWKPPLVGAQGADALAKFTKDLNELWVSPCGDEIEHAMQVWKWNNELTAGIYNGLVWPDAGQIAERFSISASAAEERLKLSQEYHKKLQNYHKLLRHWFTTHPHRPNLDTPMLVAHSIARHGNDLVNDRELVEAWKAKQAADFDGRIERDPVPTRVCDYKVRAAQAWAQSKLEEGGGIVWFFHQEFGRWLYETLTAAGIPAVYCPAGKQSDAFLTGDGAAERCFGKILVCSVTAHGTGKNMQFMGDQLFAQLPVNEMQAQQSIARTHRTGQQRDAIECTTLITTTHDDMALAAILNDAIYVAETTNSSRRVLTATWNPMPSIYGSSVLIRAGANAMMLSARQQQMLRDRFQNT